MNRRRASRPAVRPRAVCAICVTFRRAHGRELADLPGGDERQRLEQLVHRADAAREHHEGRLPRDTGYSHQVMFDWLDDVSASKRS